MKLNPLLAVLISATVAACGQNVKLDESPASIESRTGGASGQAADGSTDSSGVTTRNVDSAADNRQVAPIVADQQAAVDPLEDPDSLLAQRSVFFDYDSFTIDEQYRPIVEAHARYLVENPTRKLVLEGNTDDRGSREYNLALGQKRAEAVRRAMSVLGVSDEQVEAVSFGEERPRTVSQTEEAYAENRRTDLVYQ
ncbi:MAG: peptidoglycan-associated lipoprotein Pal [Burkholderiaceae bacterium]